MLLFGTLGKCNIFKISFYSNLYLMEYHFTTSHEVPYVARLTECENSFVKMKSQEYILVFI